MAPAPLARFFSDVERVCTHVSGLPMGDLPKQASSLDEIRAFCPQHISGLPDDAAADEIHGVQDAGSTIFVITLGSFANHMNCSVIWMLQGISFRRLRATRRSPGNRSESPG